MTTSPHATATPTPPSNVPFVLGGVSIIVGFAVLAAMTIGTVGALAGSLTRSDAPGSTTVELGRGDYVVYHEYDTVVDGAVVHVAPTADLACTVKGPDAAELPMHKVAPDMTYAIGQRQGVSVWSVSVVRPGKHVLACTYPGKSAAAIGPGFASSFLRGALGVLAAFVGTFFFVILGVVLIVWGAIRRYSWRRVTAHRQVTRWGPPG